MTKVVSKKVKCANCGTESDQLIFYSVNFSLGKKEDNERLMNHKQICPNCNYTAQDISRKIEVKENNN